MASLERASKFGYSCRAAQPYRDVRQADVAQLVAHHLAKVRVAGSNPVVRSKRSRPSPGLPPRWDGREARQRPAKPCTRVRIPLPPPKVVRSTAVFGTVKGD